MQIDLTARTDMWCKLNSAEFGAPPSEVALAALALAKPEQLGTVHVDFVSGATSSRWLLLARVAERGLLVVDATEDSRGWHADSPALNRMPTNFSAELIGLDRVDALNLLHLREVQVPFTAAPRHLEAQWSLCIAGRERPVVFPLRPEHRSESAAAIAREINVALAGPPLPIWSDN